MADPSVIRLYLLAGGPDGAGAPVLLSARPYARSTNSPVRVSIFTRLPTSM